MYLWKGKIYEHDPQAQLFADHVSDALLLMNTAETAEELSRLPGIGLASGERILSARERVGEFKTLDEVKAIPGMPPKGWDELRVWEMT